MKGNQLLRTNNCCRSLIEMAAQDSLSVQNNCSFDRELLLVSKLCHFIKFFLHRSICAIDDFIWLPIWRSHRVAASC